MSCSNGRCLQALMDQLPGIVFGLYCWLSPHRRAGLAFGCSGIFGVRP